MRPSRSIVYAFFAALLLVQIASVNLSGTPTRAQDTGPTPSPTATSSDASSNSDDSTTSATQAATADDSATAEATGTPTGRVLIQVVSRIAVFRTGPGLEFPTIAQVFRGNKIQLSGISEDSGWYMFPYNKKPTWITADSNITTLLEGDPHTLPVIPSPPTPSPRPTSAYASKADDGGFNAQYCDFDNTMTVEDQNAAVQAMYDAVDANDWVLAGKRARRLYRKCPMKAQFYLLYVVYLPVSPKHPAAAPSEDEAFALFREGWLGM